MNLMSAMGGISDKHITEFAFVHSRKRRFALCVKIASAACLTVIAAVVPRIGKIVFVPFDSSGSQSSIVDNQLEQIYSKMSRVIFNGQMYLLSTYSYPEYERQQLPEGYEAVGEILSVDPADSGKDGFSQGCNVGDIIYQNRDLENELYVYTASHYQGEPFRYLRFVDRETFELGSFSSCSDFGISINDTWYRRIDGEVFDKLPEECVLIGTVTSLDQYKIDIKSDRSWLHIGDKLYQNPDYPGAVYVYSTFFEQKDPKFLRFVDFETCKLEGKLSKCFGLLDTLIGVEPSWIESSWIMRALEAEV